MEKHFSELNKKHMSRKDFIKFLAGGTLVVFGLNNLIAYLTQYKTKTTSQTEASNGFGSRKFGV